MKRNNDQKTTCDLIAGCCTGDENAFGEIYNRYYLGLIRRISFVLRNAELAKDVLQETMIKVFEEIKHGRYRHVSENGFTSWIMRVAYNQAVDEFRRRNAVKYGCLSDSISADHYDVIADSHAQSTCTLFDHKHDYSVLNRHLTSAQRNVMSLRVFDGLDYQQIADHSSIPLNTVRTHIFQARKKMKAVLAKEPH